MKLKSSLGIIFVSLALALTSFHADAKRLGGGGSMGRQSQNVTRQQSVPSNNATTTKPSNTAAPQPQPAAPSPIPAPLPTRSPWGGVLGGLATGLGIAWLAHSMGFGGIGGAGGGSGLLTLLVVGFALWMAWNFFKRRQANNAQEVMPVYAGTHYSPYNIGNDSAARPFEYTTLPQQNAPIALNNENNGASSLSGTQTWGIPADFDTTGFLTAAKTHFINLQAAWDKADMDKLRSMMTEEMIIEIQTQIAERDAASPLGTVHHTEVMSIDAHLMGIEEVTATAQYMASVEFSGVIREEVGLAPTPFREAWNFTKPLAGGGWLVAGIQALG